MKRSGSGGFRTHLIRAGYALALLVGGVQGYLFGIQLGGVLLGVLVAINAALFAALMFGAVAGWLSRRLPQGEASVSPPLTSRPSSSD